MNNTLNSPGRLIGRNPLLRVALAIMTGIATAEATYAPAIGYACFYIIISLACLAYVIAASACKKPNSYRFANTALLAGCFSIGAFMLWAERTKTEPTWPNTPHTYTAIVTTTPKGSGKAMRADVWIANGKYKGKTVQLTFMPDTTGNGFSAGDCIIFHQRIAKPRNLGNPGEFDYASYLRRHGVSGTAFCFNSQIQRAKSQNQEIAYKEMPWFDRLKISALRLRDKLSERFATHLHGQEHAITIAMALGDKSKIDEATRQDFSTSGASHILALSGLHLGILFAVYRMAISPLSRKRRSYSVAAEAVGICGIWAFAMLAGFPVSLVRAGIMFSLMQVSGWIGRRTISVNNLSIASIIILLVSPSSLWDVGFQLSCMAVLSILVISPSLPCPGIFRNRAALRIVFNVFIISFAAQVGTLPLVAYYFNTISTYGLLTNFVAIPLAYAILVLAMMFLLLPPVGSLVALPLEISATALNKGIGLITSLPMSSLNWTPNIAAAILAYTAIGAFVYFLHERKLYRFLIAASLLIAAGCSDKIEQIWKKPVRGILFYNIPSDDAIHFVCSNDVSYILTSDTARLAYLEKSYWKKEGISSPKLLSDTLKSPNIIMRKGMVAFMGKKVLVLSGYGNKDMLEGTIAPDIIYVSKSFKGNLPRVLGNMVPQAIIVSANARSHAAEEVAAYAKARSIKFHDLGAEGYYELPL